MSEFEICFFIWEVKISNSNKNNNCNNNYY